MVIKVGARHQIVTLGARRAIISGTSKTKNGKITRTEIKIRLDQRKGKDSDHSGVPPHMAPKKIFAWPTTPARTPAEFGDNGGGDGCILCGDRDSSLLLILLLLTPFFLEDLLSDSEWRLAAFRVTAMAKGEGLDGSTATAAAVNTVGAGLFVVGETIAFGGLGLVPAFDGTEMSFLRVCSNAELNTVDELDETGVGAEMTGLVLSVCCGA